MKVIHFIDSAGLYGAEKMLLALCKEQIKAGLDPIIVSCGEEHQAEKPLETAAKSLHIKTLPWRMAKGFNLQGTKKLLQQPDIRDADIYHSHGYKFNILLGYYKGQYSQKFVTTIHGYIPSMIFSKGWLYQTLDKFMLRRADSIVYVNNVDRLRYAKRNTCATTIDNGIKIRESAAAKTTHNYKMVFIGRLSHEKGVHLIPKAIKEALNTHPSLTLDIYGLGPLAEQLQLRINTLNLQDAITLKGYLNNAEEIIEHYDCVLMPSLTEGLPIVALEALNSLRPILCTKVGGLPKLLGLNYPFFIPEKNSNTSITQSIINFFSLEQTKKTELCARIKETLIDNYSAEEMCLKYKNTYMKILQL